jgi:peptide/nickel transport system ATP-binding protein
VANLSVAYLTESGPLEAVRDVSFRIDEGESYGLVGESGSGKSTLSRAMVRFLPGNGVVRGGQVFLNDTDLLGLPQPEMHHIWGSKIGFVHQSPSTSVNPSMVVGDQIAGVARTHLGLTRRQAWKKAVEMLAQVGMPEPESVARRYAHQLSGGMLQRVLIASALTTNPELLILDEPTTALDVTTQAVILDLLEELMQRFNSAVMYITHNLGVVARLCHRVGVMYAGELLEEGPIRDVYGHPRHPYTLGLLGCVPKVNTSRDEVELQTIPGFIPRLDELPPGCVFAPRCPFAVDKCELERPVLQETASRHRSACWRWAEIDQLGAFGAKRANAGLGQQTSAELDGSPVLRAENVKKYFKARRGGMSLPGRGQESYVRAVDGVAVEVRRGSTLGIVGESGSGKSTLARGIAGLEPPDSGSMTLDGSPLEPDIARRERETLKKLQMVFQNPDASLNPQRTIAQSLMRPMSRLGGVGKDEVRQRAVELLNAVHLPSSYLSRLPGELSGGEKQRVAIARALAADPMLVICDEPISSLDVSVQASLMNLLAELQRSKGITYLFISHDLAAVRHVSDWIAVVYLGCLWEVGRAEDVFRPPSHPYTEALLSAIPIADPDAVQERIRLEGSVPSPINIPSGCRFHTRCPRNLGEICETQEPPWQQDENGHRLRCHIPLSRLGEMQHVIAFDKA